LRTSIQLLVLKFDFKPLVQHWTCLVVRTVLLQLAVVHVHCVELKMGKQKSENTK